MATGTTLAGLGDLGFLSRLQFVSAAEARLDPRSVRFDAGIEPLARLLEDTPRERVLEEVAGRIRRGLAYREMPRPWRDRYLAASVFNLKGSGESDNELVKRIRGALQA